MASHTTNGVTWFYTYDNGGNITSRTAYAYTTAKNPGTSPGPNSVPDTVNYSYTDIHWGDLLTAYKGQSITYDGIGNPLNDGTWTYTWENGRQLAAMESDTAEWTFKYNADGLRTERSNGTVTYDYIYSGSQLIQMTVGNDTLYFTYDASGTPMAVDFNGTKYFYATNLQGDIIAILDTNGNAVVEYTYDAWGNHLSTTGTMANTLGAVNPLRYRGYVFDSETALYYLQSRYYDPELGRFINADAYASTGQGILGNNMFAYCLNNPVNYADPTGTICLEIIIPLIVIILPLLTGCEDTSDSNGSAWEYEYSNSTKHNCYAHALGLTEWKWVGGIEGPLEDYSIEYVSALVMEDIIAMGWSIRPLESFDSPISENEFRIALATGESDYHFMVQHSDGTWSHKPSTLPTIHLGNLNPSQVSWDFFTIVTLPNGKRFLDIAEKNYYNQGPIYFAVSKQGG